MKILSIIPARSGSKSIKDKNIVNINGKPLIAYSIETALELKKARLIDKVVISTDSSKYADMAVSFGAEAPFLRPREMSGDKAKSIDFILHTLSFFEKLGVFYDAVLLLQPTSPLRSLEIMRNALIKFAGSNYDSAISCYKEDYVCDLVSYRKPEMNSDTLIPLNSDHNKGIRRQEHESLYVRNGCIYLTRTDFLKKFRLIISDSPMLIEMKKSESINVDGLDDLELLRMIYDYRNNRT